MDDSSETGIDETAAQHSSDLNQLHNNGRIKVESVSDSNGIEEKSYPSSKSDSRTTSSCELSDDDHDSNSSSSLMHQNKKKKLDGGQTDITSLPPCHIPLDRNEVARYFSKQCRILASRHNLPSSSKRSKPKVVKEDDINIPLIKNNGKNFPCNYCDRKFRDTLDVRRHMACVHNTEVICKDCYFFFDSKLSLDAHKKFCKKSEPEQVIHSQSFSCNMCCRSYNSQSNLDSHVVTVHSAQPYCKKCKQFFPSYTHLASHLCGVVKESTNAENNLESAEVTSNVQLLSETIPEIHILDSESEIEEISKDTKVNQDKNIVISDVLSCTQETSYACDICGMCIKNKRDLRRHKAGTHGLEPFCSYCGRTFPSEDAAKTHDCVRKFKSTTPDNNIPSQSISSDSSPPFHTQPPIDEDVMLVDLSPTGISQIPFQPQNIIGSPSLLDSNLNGMVKNLQSQGSQTNNHRRKNRCPHCNMCFVTTMGLNEHKCPYVKHCEKCNSKSILKNILEANSSRYCNKCDPEIIKTPNLSSSNKNIRLRCNVCSTELLSKQHVKHHMEIEHSNMPYCEECDSLFNNINDFTMHCQIFHEHTSSNLNCVQTNNVTPNLQVNMDMAEEKTSELITNDEIIISDDETPMSNNFEFVLVEDNDILENNTVSESTSVLRCNNEPVGAPSTEPFNPSSENILNCRLCLSFYRNFNSLKSHVKKVHHRKSLCVYCWYEVTDNGKNFLQVHYNICANYKAVKDYEKSLQNMAVSSTQQINTPPHYLGVSENSIVFNCDVCNINFATNLDLKIHTNISHNGSYLLCQYCRIEFDNMSKFITHIHGCEKSKRNTNPFEANVSVLNNEVPVINEVMHIEEQSFDSIL